MFNGGLDINTKLYRHLDILGIHGNCIEYPPAETPTTESWCENGFTVFFWLKLETHPDITSNSYVSNTNFINSIYSNSIVYTNEY